MLSISQYLYAVCQIIIDEYNCSYSKLGKAALVKVANELSSENDLAFRIGSPFRQMAHYTIADPYDTLSRTSNHDVDIIFPEERRFKIEVKYLKNWTSSSGNNTNSKNWSEYQEDFDWLHKEILEGHKNERAFIIGWFNCNDYFSRAVQLGSTRGPKPPISEARLAYFPFLKDSVGNGFTRDYVINYQVAYSVLDVYFDHITEMNCIFLGSSSDAFHIALYF